MVEETKNKAFERFLIVLGQGAAGAAAYNELRDLLIRFFRLKGLRQTEKAADETLDRVALKLTHGEQIEDFTKYALTVARYIFFEQQRLEIKERKAGESFHAQIAQNGFDPQKGEELTHYRRCYKALKPDERHILEEYFADRPEIDDARVKLAEKLGVSGNALRLRVFHLRRRLADCLRKLKKEF